MSLPALAFVPDRPAGTRQLYLHEDGKQVDAAPGGAIEKLARAGHVVLAVDLCGLGEMACPADKKVHSGYLGPDWQDMFLAYLLDRSYLALRAEQILVCGRFLAGYGASDAAGAVEATSIGRVGPALLHAAALEPELFQAVLLRRCLRGWSDVVRTPLAKNQLVNVVHGALTVYDLPDLAGTLPASKLRLEEPLDATEQPVGAQ